MESVWSWSQTCSLHLCLFLFFVRIQVKNNPFHQSQDLIPLAHREMWSQLETGFIIQDLLKLLTPYESANLWPWTVKGLVDFLLENMPVLRLMFCSSSVLCAWQCSNPVALWVLYLGCSPANRLAFSYMHGDNEPSVRSWINLHFHTVHFTERLIRPRLMGLVIVESTSPWQREPCAASKVDKHVFKLKMRRCILGL